jgi:hypothetical protein
MLRELVDYFVDYPARAATSAGTAPFPASREAAAAAAHHVAQMTDASVIDPGRRLLGWESPALPRGV